MQKLKFDIDFSKYRGKYIALVEEKVVASGENAEKILNEARSKYPKKEIVLRKIPEEEAMILVIKWK